VTEPAARAEAARRAGLGLAAVRVALGVAAIAFPSAVARPWIGTAADRTGSVVLGVDALTTLSAFPRLPKQGRWLVLFSATGAAAVGALSARYA